MSISRSGEKNGMFGKKHTKNARKKQSEARKLRDPWNKGKKGVYSQETIEKFKNIDHSGKNNSMYGKSHSEETIQKMKDAKIGRPSPRKGAILSEETKQKLRESRKKYLIQKMGVM